MDAGCLDTGKKANLGDFILLVQAFPEESSRLCTQRSLRQAQPPFPKCVGGVNPTQPLAQAWRKDDLLGLHSVSVLSRIAPGSCNPGFCLSPKVSL